MLLAKSEPPVGLRKHTEDVLASFRQLRRVWPDIPESLEAAAIFHDLGKASTGFQALLAGEAPAWQFRHEVISAAIFRQCYELSADAQRLAYIAILTHHKNLGTPFTVAQEFVSCYSQRSTSSWHSKWKELVSNCRQLKDDLAGLDPSFDRWEPGESPPSPADEVPSLISQTRPVFSSLSPALSRGAIVAADHIASSGLGSVVLGENVTMDALENYATAHIRDWKGWSAFQRNIGTQEGSAVAVAPTGAGKTEGAVLWILRNRENFERVFYVLPYQVSINAMASRLAQVFPDAEQRIELNSNENVAILHANVDLAYLQDALDGGSTDQQAKDIAKHRADAARKIYSPIKITTVFQLLDIFFGRKFFEVGLLELTNSLVVFDEIHAYDGHTMGLIVPLLESLRNLGARMLIMTATMPNKLKMDLAAAAGIDPSQQISVEPDDPLLSEVRRTITYREELIEHLTDQISAIVSSGKKTVVVCNTVSKAIKLFSILSAFNPLLVHSRFTLGDRAHREQKCSIESHNLVIATQVIEVSLDVSFEVMFTELAPVDSLLQRFGRVNRHGEYSDINEKGLCFIACGDDPGSSRIYGREVLRATKANIPEEALTFSVANQWIERVYPQGLTEEEISRMSAAAGAFRTVVAQLKPMLDPVAQLNEEALFDSIQVVPKEMEASWRKHKLERNHIEAKKLIVNVSLSSWHDALSKFGIQIQKGTLGETIAPFKYEPNQGLLLDQLI